MNFASTVQQGSSPNPPLANQEKRPMKTVLNSLLAPLVAAAALCLAPLAHAQDKLRVGVLPFSESLGAVMADKLGYFKAEGIEVEMSKFNSGALALPLLQAGKLDIAFSNTVSTLQALEQGLDGTILAPGAVVRAQSPDSTSALIVLKGAMKSPKELEGKRIAVNVINSSAWLYVTAYLDKHGVDRSKVRFVEIPFPQMNDPLLNKQVDMISQVEPFSTIMLDSGKVDALGYSYVEAQPNGDITQYVALTEWVKKNPGLAQRFARAIRKGSDYVNAPANQAAVREANVQFTNLAPALKDRVNMPRLGTSVSLDEMRKTMNMMLKYGLMKKPVDLNGRVLAAQ
jgi:NitT/TauT family transport system substrate-binding protein